MDVAEIQRVGRGLDAFLAECSDCFGRCDTESCLEVYVEGQNSDLQRKSVEPQAVGRVLDPTSKLNIRNVGSRTRPTRL